VSEERRAQIIEAAMVVFAREGFPRSRMDDIAKEAGLSKGALYWYFESKDAIIIALLEHLLNGYAEKLRTLQEAGGSATERLLFFARHAVADARRIPVQVTPLIYEFYALAMRRKALRVHIRDYFREYIELLADIIQEGIDQGEFRAVDAKKAAIQLGAMYEGLGLLWALDPETVNWEELGESTAELLLAGLKAGERSA
jgi:AcrR family transcriptional regulator